MKLLDAKWQSRYRAVKYAEFLLVALAFSIFYIVRHGPPSGVSSVVSWILFFFLGMIEWLLYFFLFLSLKYNFFRWWQTLHIVGPPSWSTIKMLLRFNEFRERRSSMQWSALLFVAIALAALLYLTHLGLVLAVLLILVEQQIIDYARRIVPPAVLFLATTNENTLRLHAGICFIIQRLRAVALLRLDGSNTDLVSVFTGQDSFRTTSDERWEEVVAGFMRTAPIIVLDGRRISSAVLREASRIIAYGVTHKLIVVIDGGGERPLLEQLGAHEDLASFQDVPLVREEGLLGMLKYLTERPNRLPTPQLPVRAIVELDDRLKIISRTDWARYPL